MFWLATAPTPALVYEQRAATAGEDEEIATPNIPVSAHLATREKVIPVSPLYRRFQRAIPAGPVPVPPDPLKLDGRL